MHTPTRSELLAMSPEWWKVEGAKIEIMKVLPNKIYLASRAVRIYVSHIPIEKQKGGRAWLWSSTLRFSPENVSRLDETFETDWLRGIFCGEIIKNRDTIGGFTVDSGVSGSFVRTGQFASIPGPGRRCAGDQAISVMIKRYMPQAFEHLIKQNE